MNTETTFIYNGVPETCAGCGAEIKFDEVEQMAWATGISYVCNTCGSLHQFSTEDNNILDTADEIDDDEDVKNLYKRFFDFS